MLEFGRVVVCGGSVIVIVLPGLADNGATTSNVKLCVVPFGTTDPLRTTPQFALIVVVVALASLATANVRAPAMIAATATARIARAPLGCNIV
jgi:hypothetical protein